jgi:TM2 domain-containing membrane protein YozV
VDDAGETSYHFLGSLVSTTFEILSTRTLLRHQSSVAASNGLVSGSHEPVRGHIDDDLINVLMNLGDDDGIGHPDTPDFVGKKRGHSSPEENIAAVESDWGHHELFLDEDDPFVFVDTLGLPACKKQMVQHSHFDFGGKAEVKIERKVTEAEGRAAETKLLPLLSNNFTPDAKLLEVQVARDELDTRMDLLEGEVGHHRPPPNLCVAYMCLLLGMFGTHHFYLKRHNWGILYLCTMGLLGWGVVVDFFQLPSLVRRQSPEREEDSLFFLGEAYALCGPIFSFLGLHHFYLLRHKWGLLYLCTGGLFFTGWLVDLCCMPWIVAEENEKAKVGYTKYREMQLSATGPYKTREACSLGMGLGGFLGLHRFYLGQWGRGFSYLFTMGWFGLGALSDMYNMPDIVERANASWHFEHEPSGIRDGTRLEISELQGRHGR